jgi:hypothetical protein
MSERPDRLETVTRRLTTGPAVLRHPYVPVLACVWGIGVCAVGAGLCGFFVGSVLIRGLDPSIGPGIRLMTIMLVIFLAAGALHVVALRHMLRKVRPARDPKSPA